MVKPLEDLVSNFNVSLNSYVLSNNKDSKEMIVNQEEISQLDVVLNVLNSELDFIRDNHELVVNNKETFERLKEAVTIIGSKISLENTEATSYAIGFPSVADKIRTIRNSQNEIKKLVNKIEKAQKNQAAKKIQNVWRKTKVREREIGDRIASIKEKMVTNYGFETSVVSSTLNELVRKLEQQNIARLPLLTLIDQRLDQYGSLNELVETMKEKSGDLACEAMIKLLLYAEKEERIQEIYSVINESAQEIQEQLKENDIELKDIEKVLGYILTLNLNQKDYMEALLLSEKIQVNKLTDSKNIKKYEQFVMINKQAETSSRVAVLRREILFRTDLLQTHLQRDPEEASKYDAQMAAAYQDKMRLLDHVNKYVSSHEPLTVIDIGPAGGATFKAVSALCSKDKKNQVAYVGVELDLNELRNLNALLESEKTAKEQVRREAQFVQGNALDLQSVIENLADVVGKDPIDIVLSSVVHEIYSYCPYEEQIADDLLDIETMVDLSEISSYNPQTVYKIYEEGLLALSKNGGSLNVRDGVMVANSNEEVTFKLSNESWLEMFKDFVSDKKYAHLKNDLKPLNKIQVGDTLKLPAKYVQEFMIKANWGSESFGNEINEVYCYMRLEDHKKILQSIAKKNGLEIEIAEEDSYTQQGYIDNISKDKIEIVEGFGATKMPPTNMLLRVQVKPV